MDPQAQPQPLNSLLALIIILAVIIWLVRIVYKRGKQSGAEEAKKVEASSQLETHGEFSGNESEKSQAAAEDIGREKAPAARNASEESSPLYFIVPALFFAVLKFGTLEGVSTSGEFGYVAGSALGLAFGVNILWQAYGKIVGIISLVCAVLFVLSM